MRVFDRRLVRPTYLHLVQSLREATAAANGGEQLLEFGPEHWPAFATTLRPEPEGLRGWAGAGEPGGAARLGLAWWTDHLGRRHFRIWADRQPAGDRPLRGGPASRLGANDSCRPPLWHVYPDRLFLRRRGRQRDLLAVCACGACDSPRALGWVGPCCRLCHDRRVPQPAPADEPRLTLRQHTGPVRALAFAPDGRTLASAGEVGLTFSAEGEVEASRRDDWRVRVWDVARGELLGPLGSAEEQLLALAVSPDGRLLASVSGERTLRLTDLATGKEWRSNQVPAGVRALAFAPDGLALALLAEKELEVWARAAPGAAWLPARNRGGAVGAVALSPRPGVLAVGEKGGWLRLTTTDRSGPDQPLRPLVAAAWAARALAFTAGGRLLHSLCAPPPEPRGPETPREHVVQSWHVETGQEQRSTSFWLAPQQAWAFSDDGRWLAGLCGHVLALVDAFGAGPHHFLEWSPDEPLTCLAFAADGEVLATGGAHGTVKLWPWRRLLEA
jgi:hypothetical protein